MDIELQLAADKRVRIVTSDLVYSPATANGGMLLDDVDALDGTTTTAIRTSAATGNTVMFDLRCYDSKGHAIKVCRQTQVTYMVLITVHLHIKSVCTEIRQYSRMDLTLCKSLELQDTDL
jgi:hypothetical protein